MNKMFLPKYTLENKAKFNYAIDIMDIDIMWKNSIKGKNVNIAIIDSGCDVNHEELKDNIIGVYNFTNDDNGSIHNVTDYLGHGTHIAGIIGSQNKKYRIGVAPESNLLILKVINKSGFSEADTLIKAIKYAKEWKDKNKKKIDIINLSLGTSKDHQGLKKIINKGISENIIMVAAAGNQGDGNYTTNEISYPGFYKDVFEIGATDKNSIPTSFSNSNINIDFLAPGKDIFSSFPNNNYATLSGTSMAAPQVSGVIALIKNQLRNNGLEPTYSEIDNYLKQRVRFLPNYPKTAQGYGLIKI